MSAKNENTMFSLKISHSQKKVPSWTSRGIIFYHIDKTPHYIIINFIAIKPTKNFLLHKILVIQKLPFNETTQGTHAWSDFVSTSHILIQRFMPQTFTPYLLNRENFLEHIFSLSIEFLYHSVSESSKAIIIHIYPWSCAVFILRSKPIQWSYQCGPICEPSRPLWNCPRVEVIQSSQ